MRASLYVGLLAAALGLAFQSLTVHYNYGGDWTALFCVGDRFPQPPDLPKPYQFRGSFGYDAQGYRLIAHDPFATRGFDRFIDDPRYRYSRILVPLLAWTFALGNDRWIDAAYILTVSGFIFAGAFWLSKVSRRFGFPAWWGLLFLLAPATLIGLDRLTVDVAMAALCVAFVALRPGSAGWLTALAAAALCRETGFLLIAAACTSFLWERSALWGKLQLARSFSSAVPTFQQSGQLPQFPYPSPVRLALLTASTALPALAWMTLFASHLRGTTGGSLTSPVPLSGFVARLSHPLTYPLPAVIAATTQVLDYVALAGVLIALACLWRLRARPELWACAIPVLFVGFSGVWNEVYAFGRTMTPFWLLIAIRGAETRLWVALVPIALMDLRIGWQLGGQVWGIVKGLVT